MRRWPLSVPAYWVVENAWVEGFFAKLIWGIVPVQYILLTHINRGLKVSDYSAAALLSLASVILMFVAACATAAIVAVFFSSARVDYQKVARMWVVSLLIGWAGANILYTLSVYYGPKWDFEGDLVGATLRNYMCAESLPGPNWPTVLSYLVYAYLSFFIIIATRFAHIRFWGTPQTSPALPEPDLLWSGVMVATVMLAINLVATKPAARPATIENPAPACKDAGIAFPLASSLAGVLVMSAARSA
jgi:hypothetical protein